MMPARDTVAGDALLRFSGSNIAFMVPDICTRSPLASVSTLLSSSTVLRFSIQMASTGPSSTIHVLFFFSLAARRHSTANTPSVQSPVVGSMRPNICGAVMALGFIFQMTCLVPSSLSAPASVSQIAVLPAPVGPTSMMPWRTWYVSYSCTHLDSQLGCSCSPLEVTTLAIAASTSGNTALSALMPGKMSSMREINSGTSSATNLDMFMSRSVRMTRKISDFSGFSRFEDPMVRSTDRMLRKPKS
mmetsp:Transcript_29254/g.72343  ORF Transcript_29254/g.72343 Transcript_29254/m.72343 type:complete len:245 (+) Transcript_29254:3147-3881(+)